MMMQQDVEKRQVYDFWNRASCGEDLYLASSDLSAFKAQSEMRYCLEPYIHKFAQFEATKGLRVLEIGVGLGADHQCFAEAGAELYGIDLTERAVAHTLERLALFGLTSNLSTGDAEHLNYPDAIFDLVYSWGVLHHSPDTPKAIAEVYRVLKPGGGARVMIYHTWSMVGLMLWLRYALLVGRPWRNLRSIYAKYLESPGTKAYTVAEAQSLFDAFNEVQITTVLSHGDLLESGAGQRHGGWVLLLARQIWPRRLIRTLFPKAGLFMLIQAKK
jgi:SAM-dependent methyltransferase